ncbi:MAG: excinuclease ABC subunit UvrC [Candidatus Margulisbacteria bacterium]|nr:excinuclease ABC subunit UvrC [Candidatus Margulisiibacteriota bacterium]
MQKFPDQPGVYFFKDKAGEIIYIGKAKSLKRRIASYFNRPADSPKLQALLDHLHSIEFICTATELEALLLENRLIKKHQPKYNIMLRDDKNYPYIKLTMQEEWPRLLMVRQKLDDGALYFGRYDAGGIKETIRLIKKFFPIRWCKSSPMRTREQPCLQYHIKHCLGPCIGKISQQEYRNLCKAIASLLSGRMSDVTEALKKEMDAAAGAHKYELAAKLRDQINKLERVTRTRPRWVPRRIVRQAQNSLLELKDTLHLPKIPFRVEAFDVSNIQGEDCVASMVVFENGEPKKKDYRRFKIRGTEGPNDAAAINEVVKRRYTKTLKDKLPLPDLILIDGGKPQVNAAKRALPHDIPIFGLAKKEELLFAPHKSRPIRLPLESPALLLLRAARDEAHRFAITYHRAKRKKSLGLGQL